MSIRASAFRATGSTPVANRATRRSFLAGMAALGATALLHQPSSLAAERPPEVTKIRLVRVPALCFAPQYLAEEFLRLEGFAEVEYVPLLETLPTTLGTASDIGMIGSPSLIAGIDRGVPVVALAGVHQGCWELFAHERVRSVKDLRGRRIGVIFVGALEHVWLSGMLAYVGIDPRKDVEWVEGRSDGSAKRMFVEGKIDAFLAFPPEPQELRGEKIGRVILNTTVDRPWSQYFCCVVAGRREFVAQYPVATRRALRGLLKASDFCSREPERAARMLVDRGYESNYPFALEVLTDLSYNRWRTDNPEDTMRFHALRLRDAGIIRSTPEQIIERGTDFRILRDLKKELKA
jgi:NitT/TauT family transport system substrate-binding protein